MASEDAIVSGMAGRYATALFELTQAEGTTDTVAADLAALQAMLDQSADLSRLIKSPVFPADEQARGIMAVAKAAGLSATTRNFLGVVARNRRLFALPDIIRGYRALIANARGEVTAEVVSATPLSPAQLADLADALRAMAGRDAKIASRVDPAILGGLVVKIGSRMIDNSLRTKLNKLKTALGEVR